MLLVMLLLYLRLLCGWLLLKLGCAAREVQALLLLYACLLLQQVRLIENYLLRLWGLLLLQCAQLGEEQVLLLPQLMQVCLFLLQA